MACGGVDEQGVSPCGDQGLGPVQVVGAYAYGSAAAQMAVVVLGGVRKHGTLLDVRFRDQAGKNAVFIHEGEFFNAVRVKDVAGFFNSGAGGGGNQAGKRGHHILHQHVFVIVHSAHIAAGDDAFQLSVGIYYGEAGVTLVHHDVVDFFKRHVLAHRDGIRDDSVLKPFHAGDHGRLDVDGIVAVDDGEAAFTCQGNGQFRFGNGVHGRGKHGDFHVESGNELGTDVRITGKNRAQAGQQEHVVKT